jgi:hypothetical protein
LKETGKQEVDDRVAEKYLGEYVKQGFERLQEYPVGEADFVQEVVKIRSYGKDVKYQPEARMAIESHPWFVGEYEVFQCHIAKDALFEGSCAMVDISLNLIFRLTVSTSHPYSMEKRWSSGYWLFRCFLIWVNRGFEDR